MAERLGLAVIPGISWRATEIQAIALEAEEAGFDAIFAAEDTGAGYHPRCR